MEVFEVVVALLLGGAALAALARRIGAPYPALADDVTIHDIQRTVADSLLNRMGAQPWVVDHVVLGHARPKLLQTYMPTLPLKEAREAVQKWGEEIERILSAEASVAGQGLERVSSPSPAMGQR